MTHPVRFREPERVVSVAPMMDCTDRHCRFLMRQIAPRVRLYTEMLHANAVLQGDRARLLGFDPCEHPLALQLGGSDPALLARAARAGAECGYDEINLNVGCPSDRVQSGRFGACLMAHPEQVAECVAAMREATDRPVTVKTRIGIDDHDDYEFLRRFVAAIDGAGCRHLIVHARKAILSGLSPKENRSVPPLDYSRVYRLKRDFPDLFIAVNGGIETIAAARRHLEVVDGVMIGRKAYAEPMFLAQLQAEVLGGANPAPQLDDLVNRMADYAAQEVGRGVRLHHISRHMFGLASGRPGARRWRRFLSERAAQLDAGPEVLRESLQILHAAA